jgi:Family of unknown function (DUF5670)
LCGSQFDREVYAVGIDLAGSKAQASFTVSRKDGTGTMLWTILMVILVLWLLGLIGGVGGSLIHLLLVVAAVVLIIQLVTGRRAVV